jgi:sortase (surface protein transpeptidase)
MKQEHIHIKKTRRIFILGACMIFMLAGFTFLLTTKSEAKMMQIEKDIVSVRESNAKAEAVQKEHLQKIDEMDTSTGDIISFVLSDDWKNDGKRDTSEYEGLVESYAEIIDWKDYETRMLYQDEPLRDRGRLYIPSCGVDVPLCSGIGYKKGQDVVDEENLALMEYFSGDLTICDHAGQGFDRMKKADVGTVGFIKTRTGLQKIVCTGKIRGDNVRYALYYDNGGSLGFYNLDGVTMYTCNDETGVSVTVSFWKYDDFSTDDFIDGTSTLIKQQEDMNSQEEIADDGK